MFRENENHLQGRLFSTINQLPKTGIKRLEQSWAHSFYQNFFCQIDESIFADLYSSKKSRPNVPVNILVGLEAIKSAFGYSDEELYDNFLYNLQIRYALGLHDIGEQHFEIRTIYNFRKSLVEYEKRTGNNLIGIAFEQITDVQLEKLNINTQVQRMDSTLIQSNIRNMGRLQLLVECILRMHRELNAMDGHKHKELFQEFIKENSLHYCYRVKAKDSGSKLEQIGNSIHKILDVLKENYCTNENYVNLARIFAEHFEVIEEGVRTKENTELTGSMLQSPDDTEATYRKKNLDKSKGYVSNISETCDKDNIVNLITRVSLECNTTDDQELLINDVENILGRMELNELYTDAGYEGKKARTAVAKLEVDHKLTAIKGKKREGFGLDAFEPILNSSGIPISMKCPNGQIADVKSETTPERLKVEFDGKECAGCPLMANCPTRQLKRGVNIMRFTLDDFRAIRQRKACRESGKEKNIRASIESTVRSVIHPFGGHNCKMPVRGRIRITHMIILSAAMVNIRRIMSTEMENDANLVMETFLLLFLCQYLTIFVKIRAKI